MSNTGTLGTGKSRSAKAILSWKTEPHLTCLRHRGPGSSVHTFVCCLSRNMNCTSLKGPETKVKDRKPTPHAHPLQKNALELCCTLFCRCATSPGWRTARTKTRTNHADLLRRKAHLSKLAPPLRCCDLLRDSKLVR